MHSHSQHGNKEYYLLDALEPGEGLCIAVYTLRLYIIRLRFVEENGRMCKGVRYIRINDRKSDYKSDASKYGVNTVH